MEAEQASLVCEPFYRVDQARSRSSGGVGLGLSLCREIAQLHGGELKISSYPGKGTTVQIVFT
ncbi:MAG TPA: ATP-binding protein, partial [Desulfosporosinus sp.]|nr:ATP-binding protein [Desulfosporosinus sp.]